MPSTSPMPPKNLAAVRISDRSTETQTQTATPPMGSGGRVLTRLRLARHRASDEWVQPSQRPAAATAARLVFVQRDNAGSRLLRTRKAWQSGCAGSVRRRRIFSPTPHTSPG
jgi:hypothetical protein